jgi:hypothetical protein
LNDDVHDSVNRGVVEARGLEEVAKFVATEEPAPRGVVDNTVFRAPVFLCSVVAASRINPFGEDPERSYFSLGQPDQLLVALLPVLVQGLHEEFRMCGQEMLVDEELLLIAADKNLDGVGVETTKC